MDVLLISQWAGGGGGGGEVIRKKSFTLVEAPRRGWVSPNI